MEKQPADEWLQKSFGGNLMNQQEQELKENFQKVNKAVQEALALVDQIDSNSEFAQWARKWLAGDDSVENAKEVDLTWYNPAIKDWPFEVTQAAGYARQAAVELRTGQIHQMYLSLRGATVYVAQAKAMAAKKLEKNEKCAASQGES